MMKPAASPSRRLIARWQFSLVGIVLGLLMLLVCLILSITQGAADIPVGKILAALFAFDGSREHLIIATVRLPRSLIAILVGAALAVAGAIMQGLTRNPLADPGILALESGAAVAVVLGISFFNAPSQGSFTGLAFIGAGVTAVVVYFLASLGRGGLTPLNLTIAGAAVSALLSSVTTAILILNQRTLEEIRFWLAGSIAGADFALCLQVLPFILVGLVLAFVLGRQITILNLGEDVAKGLGQQTTWVKVIAAVSVMLLAGSSVAVAGPIGFVGLVVPHMVRFFVGVDYRWILPYAAILGAILLLLADMSARLLIAPPELPVGVMTAIIGGLFFIYLARSQVKK
jgi:iron complex transport system permease protein